MSSKPTAIICDLDGTLAIHDGRRPYEYEKCDTDLVNEPVLFVLDALYYSAASIDAILFVSGREDSCYALTERWLKDRCHFIVNGEIRLFMRKSKDYRKDYVIKEEIYREHIEPDYDVLFCLDDRPSVIRMWLSLGVYVLAAGGGQREF